MSDPKSFSLVGQNLKLDTKADIQTHLETLAAIEDLQEVHLGGNTLGVEACQALAEVLKTKKTLKVADFADIFTGRLISEIPDALRALCDALQDNENLVELNLSDNAFGGRSAEPMVNFLKHNHHFSVLKLNNNGLGITGGTIVAEALIAAAEELKSKGLESKLRAVICGRNRLENGSAPVWAKAFAAHGGLVEVRMFQNGIRMEGIEAISQGLSACPDLEVLDLQDNTATLRGSRAIAACLPRWPSLKTLNLSDCLLKPKGGALVFGALANGGNTQLETLQVQYCDLDRKALDMLGGAIHQHLKNLTKLEINGNWADEEDACIIKIKDGLAKWEHAEALDELDEMDPEGEEDEAEAEDAEEEDTEPASNPYKEAGLAGAAIATAGTLTAGAATANAADMTSTEPHDTTRLADSLEKTQIADEANAATASTTSGAADTPLPAQKEVSETKPAPAIVVPSSQDGAGDEKPVDAVPLSAAPAAAAQTAAARAGPSADATIESNSGQPMADASTNAATTPTVGAAASTEASEGKKEKKKGGLKGLLATIKQKLA